MAQKKEAILNIGKALMGVSFTTLAAIGSATGNIWLAGLAALPGAVLSSSETVGTQLAHLRTSTSPNDELLVLPAPTWRTLAASPGKANEADQNGSRFCG